VDVNLSPVGYSQKRRFYWPRIALTLFICFYFLAFFYIIFFLTVTRQHLKAENSLLSGEISALAALVTETKALQQRNREFAERADTLASLDKEALVWSAYLNEINLLTEGNVTITDFWTDSGMVNIRCRTHSFRDAALFVYRLKRMNLFASAEYEYMVLDNNVVEIRISTKLTPGEKL